MSLIRHGVPVKLRCVAGHTASQASKRAGSKALRARAIASAWKKQ